MTRSLIFALTTGLALAFTSAAQGAEPIRVGQSAPLSGSNKELGQDARDGALAYFNRVNEAGGVHGRKIELISLDDGNKTSASKANTQKLIEEHRVVALFGYGSATLSLPALPAVEQAKIPFFAPLTGADVMREYRPYVYNHRASYADELEKTVDHYAALGLTRFAVIHHEDRVGKENLEAVLRALKARDLPVVAIAALQRTESSFSSAAAQLVKANPQVIIATTLYSTTAGMFKEARAQGSHAEFVSTSFAGSTALARALGEQGVGVLMSQVVPNPARSAIPVVREYQQAMRALGEDKQISYTSLESYIAAKALVEGLRRAGPEPTRASLLKALDALRFDAGGYYINFTPKDHNGSSFVALTVLSRDMRFRD